MSKITKVSLDGLAEIVSHEGIVQMPYLDSVGVWTFGIGHTAAAGAPNPSTMARGKEQPLSYVLEVFTKDIAKFEREVVAAVKVPLKQHEFDALVSFHYNTGGIARALLTAHLNKGDRAAAAEAFMGWQRPPEIIPRRRAEQALFRTGRYGTGLANVYPADANGRVQWSSARRVDVRALLRSAAPAAPSTGPKAGEIGTVVGVGTSAGGAAAAAGFDPLAIAAIVVVAACIAIGGVLIYRSHTGA